VRHLDVTRPAFSSRRGLALPLPSRRRHGRRRFVERVTNRRTLANLPLGGGASERQPLECDLFGEGSVWRQLDLPAGSSNCRRPRAPFAGVTPSAGFPLRARASPVSRAGNMSMGTRTSGAPTRLVASDGGDLHQYCLNMAERTAREWSSYGGDHRSVPYADRSDDPNGPPVLRSDSGRDVVRHIRPL
jgi:hypothetical protein